MAASRTSPRPAHGRRGADRRPMPTRADRRRRRSHRRVRVPPIRTRSGALPCRDGVGPRVVATRDDSTGSSSSAAGSGAAAIGSAGRQRDLERSSGIDQTVISGSRTASSTGCAGAVRRPRRRVADGLETGPTGRDRRWCGRPRAMHAARLRARPTASGGPRSPRTTSGRPRSVMPTIGIADRRTIDPAERRATAS